MNQHQIGYIEVTNETLEDFWINNREFVPLDVVNELHKATKRYLCYCKHFRALKDGEHIPSYMVEYKRCNKSGVCLMFKITEIGDTHD